MSSTLRPGGQLVLETLIIESPTETVLVPEGRYAKMPNVWFIPSVPMLMRWLRRAGYSDCRLVHCGRTGLDEQRRTSWMRYESLADFLNPDNPEETIEGYPAPTRAIVTARVS